jgi:branched-chain amino acid transport system ATP-binding protein
MLKDPDVTLSASAALAVTGVSVRFGGVQALDDVSLAVNEGQVCGIIGPNGAGKTTLFDVISGLRSPQSGRISLKGRDVTRWSAAARARAGLRRTFQQQQVFGHLSVEDNVILALEWRGGGGGVIADLLSFPPRRRLEAKRRQEVREVLELCGLSTVASVRASALPIGMARRVEVARAIVDPPKILLLDEPTSGLDASDVDRLGSIIRNVVSGTECALLLVEHDVNFVMELSSVVLVLNAGKVLAKGTPHAIRRDDNVRAVYLG